MKPVHTLLSAGLLSLALHTPAYSQTVSSSVDDMPPNSTQGIPRPAAGMSQEQVVQQFGQPLERIAPVGEPPISRWVYDKFTVYFEHQYVLHAVVHR